MKVCAYPCARGTRSARSSPRPRLVFKLAVMGETVGMAGVVAALSVVSDLARGHPPGEAVRACLLATELARRAGLDERGQGEV